MKRFFSGAILVICGFSSLGITPRGRVVCSKVAVAVSLNATPAFRAAGAASSGIAAVTPGLPTGHVTNDILLCFVQSSNQAIAVPTNSGAGTWAEVTNSPQGTGTAATATAVRVGVFWMRDLGTSIGTVTVADSGDHTIAQICAYSGCLTIGNPWNITAGRAGTASGTQLTHSSPALNTTVGNCLIVIAFANAVDSVTSQFAANIGTGNLGGGTMNKRADSNTSSGTGGGFTILDGTLASAGDAVGSGITINLASASTNEADLLIALTSN